MNIRGVFVLAGSIAVLISGCATRQLNPVFQPLDIGYDGTARTYGDSISSRLNHVNLADMISKGSKDLDDAFRTFRNGCRESKDAANCQFDRNGIQDRLIAASNSICKDYKVNLKQAQANTNLNFGSASTILGGLGAVVQTATPARLYSGSASVASGLRAEVNQNIYAMLAVEVISKAIDKARSQKLREIEESRKLVLTNYTLERAIADVVDYHERCSLLSGLQEAASAVSQSENIGIKTLGQTLADLGQTTTIQLGKKTYNIGGSDTVLMKTKCKTLKGRYDDFVKSKHIDDSKKDFIDIRDSWERIFGDPSYCKNLDETTGDVAAAFDKRWQDLVDEFTKQTDEKERERVLGLIDAQQSGAKVVATVLSKALDTTLSDLQVAIGRIDAATAAVANVASIGFPDPLETSSNTTDISNCVKTLTRLREASNDALNRIMATKSSFTATEKAALVNALNGIDSIKNSTDVAAINSAIRNLKEPISGLTGWKPQ